MDLFAAREKLQKLGESHLLDNWPMLEDGEKEHLLNQIEALDGPLLLKEKSLLIEPHKEQKGRKFSPPIYAIRDAKYSAAGEKILSQGAVGAIIMAGGQGSRLGFPHPKGCYPITTTGKSLFQL